MYVCMYIYIYIYIYIYVYTYLNHGVLEKVTVNLRPAEHGRFPKFRRVFSGRDPGTLKSDIVSKNIHN